MKLYQGNPGQPREFAYWRSMEAASQPNAYAGVRLHYPFASIYQARVKALRVTTGTASTFLMQYSDEHPLENWIRGLNYGWARKISDYGMQTWHGDQVPVSNLSVPAEQATGQVIDLSLAPILIEAPGGILIYTATLNDFVTVDLWWSEQNVGWSRDAPPYNPQ